jgi:hypothetical protein
MICIVLAILAGTGGMQCQKHYAAPEKLIGVWVTDNPVYHDHPFEIKKKSVIFEQGQGYFDFHVYPIAGVKKTKTEEGVLYTIYYTIPSGRNFEFAFYYTAANGGEIRFKNQPEMVWTKREG